MWIGINVARRARLARNIALRAAIALFVGGALFALPVSAQDALQLESTSESSFDPTPQTRMRPIGEPSRVDQFRSQSASQNGSIRKTQNASRPHEEESAQANPLRYAARQSGHEVPSLQSSHESRTSDGLRTDEQRDVVVSESGTGSLRWSDPRGTVSQVTETSTADASPFPIRRMVFQSPEDQVPNAAPALPADPSLGGGMGFPGVSPPLPGTSAGSDSFAPRETTPLRTMQDSSPVPMPRIEDQMATIDNCSAISAPSTYTAGGSWGCGTETVGPRIYSQPGSYVQPPAMIAPPVVTPAMAPGAYSNLGHRPLFTLGQDAYNAQIGRGIIGQPTAYVPGQPMRNFLRYLTP